MKSAFIGLLSIPAMFVLGIGFLFLGALTISAFFYIYNKFKFDFSYKKKKEQQRPVTTYYPNPKQTNKKAMNTNDTSEKDTKIKVIRWNIQGLKKEKPTAVLI